MRKYIHSVKHALLLRRRAFRCHECPGHRDARIPPAASQAARGDRQGRKRYLHQPRRVQQHHRHHHSYQHHQLYRRRMAPLVSIRRTVRQRRLPIPPIQGLITRWTHGTMVSLESAPEQRRPLPSRRGTTTILSDIYSPLWTTAPPTAHRRRCSTHLDHLDRFFPKTK